MNENKPNTVVCECCDLDVPERLASAVVNAHQLVRGWRCRRCNEHQGNPLKMAQDHEDDVRIRWDGTVDELHVAQDLADDYREKMKAAYRQRDSVLLEFEKLGRYHRETGQGCICGRRRCETLAIVDSDSINERIAAMHRHDRTG
jgi:hypothetical protein